MCPKKPGHLTLTPVFSCAHAFLLASRFAVRPHLLRIKHSLFTTLLKDVLKLVYSAVPSNISRMTLYSSSLT